jgi:hypothetical protein
MPAPARVKILYPAITTEPSMHAEILGVAEKWMQVRVPRLIVVGSTVQVRGGGRVAFGSVRASLAVGCDYEIDVDVARSS